MIPRRRTIWSSERRYFGMVLLGGIPSVVIGFIVARIKRLNNKSPLMQYF